MDAPTLWGNPIPLGSSSPANNKHGLIVPSPRMRRVLLPAWIVRDEGQEGQKPASAWFQGTQSLSKAGREGRDWQKGQGGQSARGEGAWEEGSDTQAAQGSGKAAANCASDGNHFQQPGDEFPTELRVMGSENFTLVLSASS